MKRKLMKSRTDRKIFGVCGGIAEYFDIDPVLVRLAMALLVLYAGSGLVFYILCAIIMSDEPTL